MYTEVVVLRKNAGGSKLLKTIFLVFAACCLIVGIAILPITLVGAVVFGLLYWKIAQHVDIEYQYNHMDDDFDIDKVIANTRRKHVLTVKTSQIILVAPVDSADLAPYQSWSTLDVSANDPDQKPYVMVCHVDGAKKKILIQMNDSLLKSLKRQLGSKVVEIA